MVRIQHPAPQKHPGDDKPLTEEELVEQIMTQARELANFARDPRDGEDEITFRSFERALKPKVFAIARTAVVLFLTCAEARVRSRIPTWLLRSGRCFQKTKARARNLTTWFGKVRYWRTYMLERGVGQRTGATGSIPSMSPWG